MMRALRVVVVVIAAVLGAHPVAAGFAPTDVFLSYFYTPGNAIAFVPQAGTTATIRDESGSVVWQLSATLENGEVHLVTGLAPGHYRVTSSAKIVLLAGDMVTGSGADSRGYYAQDVDGRAVGTDLYTYLRASDDDDNPALVLFSHEPGNAITVWSRGEFAWELQWQGTLGLGAHQLFQMPAPYAAALRITSTGATSALTTGTDYYDLPSAYCVPSSSSGSFYGLEFDTFAPGGELYFYSFADGTHVDLVDATTSTGCDSWDLAEGEVAEYLIPLVDSLFYTVDASQPIVVCRMFQHLVGGGGMHYVPAKSGAMVGTEFVVDAVDPVEVVAYQDGTAFEYTHGYAVDSYSLDAGGHQTLPPGTSGTIMALKAVSVVSTALVGATFVPIPVSDLATAPGPPAVFAVRHDPPLPTVLDTTVTVTWATDEPCTSCMSYRRNGGVWMMGICTSTYTVQHSLPVDVSYMAGNDLVEYYVWSTDKDNNTVTNTNGGQYYGFTITPDLPQLEVTRLAVLPPGTPEDAYSVILRVANTGIAAASSIEIRERLLGMISPTAATTLAPVTTRDFELRLAVPDIAAGDTAYVAYELVPVLYGTYSTFGVGILAPSTYTYRSPGWHALGGGFDDPVTFDTGAALAWIAAKDYVVATNVGRLASLYTAADAGTVLEEAARFALARGAVVADLETTDPWAVEQLVDSDWNGRLGPLGYGDGWHFLLLLGSPAVVPSWEIEHDCVAIDPRRATTADNVYADVAEGDHFKPEVILGRMPGRSATQLVDQLQRSLTPISTDRTVLMSGVGDGEGDFVSCVDDLDENWLAQYTTTVVRHWKDLAGPTERMLTFLSDAPSTDLFVYRDHGTANSWDNTVDNGVVAVTDFGGKNPMVWSIACWTGNLSGTPSLAEAFLDRGASLFIGSTEVSQRSPNNDFTGYLGTFHSTTAYYPTMGVAFKAAKRKLIDDNIHGYSTCIGDAGNKQLVNEYNLYGDPKRGEPPFSGRPTLAALAGESGAQRDPPPTSVDVTIPPFEVWTSADGLNHVLFPGEEGGTFEEEGQPVVPTWIHRVPFGSDWKVQGVLLQERAGLEEVEGLVLPTASFAPDDGSPAATATTRAVFPPRDVKFAWKVEEQGDGSHELVLTAFPFSHDPATGTSWCFHTYSFRVASIASPLAVAAFSVDQPEVPIGSPVQGALEVDNHSAVVEVALLEVDAFDGDQNELLGSMDPVALALDPGHTVVPWSWVVDAATPADRRLRARLTRPDEVLDEAWVRVRVGELRAAEVGLEVSPTPSDGFDVGDAVTALASFASACPFDVAGQVRFAIVETATGRTVHASVYDRVLPAYATQGVQMLWDTSTATPGSYLLSAVFEYDGRTTDPMTAGLFTRLPLTAQLATDRTQYEVGDKIVVWITTTGPDGNPVDASVAAFLVRPDSATVPLELTTVPGSGLSFGSHFLGAGSPPGTWAVLADASSPGFLPAHAQGFIAVGGSPPTPSFEWTPATPFVGEPVQFTDTSAGEPTSWAWGFGDGAVSSLQDPTHTYSQAGWMEVTLMVSNGYGTTWLTEGIEVREVPLFADGFESGSCDGWASAVP